MKGSAKGCSARLAVVGLIAGSQICAAQQQLSSRDAAVLIRSSKDFSGPRRVEMVAGGRMPLNITRDHYLVFRDLGLIRMSIEGDIRRVAEVHLTRKGELASKGWSRTYVGSYGGSDLWHVPVASRTLLQTEEVVPEDSNHVRVQFTWKWTPGEIGRALRLSEDPYQAVVHFKRDSDKWRLLEAGSKGLRVRLSESEWSQ